MKSLIKITLLFTALPLLTFAQKDCTCADHFKWLKKTFEENDAGFQYALDQKGKDAYEMHNQRFKKRLASITKLEDCTRALFDWLRFFRAGHIAIQPKQASSDNGTPDKATIIRQFKNWERYEMSSEKLKKYLATPPTNGFEGIWLSPPYKVAVVKQDKDYIGFILEADGVYWRANQVKFKLTPSGNTPQYKATFFMRNHSPRHFDKVFLLDNNILSMGFITFKRQGAKLSGNTGLSFKLAKSRTPMIIRLSEQTLVLRIPSFRSSSKKAIDSVLKAHHEQIISTPNLIIDIRNGTGGSDRSYKNIIPYLYTNPLRNIGVQYLSTPLNNSRMKKFMKDPDFTEEEKEWARKGLEKLNKNPGKFISLSDQAITIKKLDKVYKYPETVGIMINQNNGSTDEQFLLATKQSKKVKLFGTTTFGVLDISNMHFVDSPCKHFSLGYCLTKSFRIPGMAIDGKGIQPDYYIDDSFHELQWLEYVKEIIEGK